jgi:hypothetical protein
VNPALLSSARETWNTPESFLALVRRLGPLGLDPCSNAGSVVRARVEWRLEWGHDGLTAPWGGHGLVFCNPPYGRELKPWAEKIAREAGQGVEVVTLVPARPGSSWWRTLSTKALVCYLDRRLTFGAAPAPAPFPSAVFYHGPRGSLFTQIFSEAGAVSLPPVTVRSVTCVGCGLEMHAQKSTRRTCSDRCRQRAARARRVGQARPG